jgi:TubC N-terminal docking domain
MTALSLLEMLHTCGVRLTPYPEGTLRYRAPKGSLTPALCNAIREHKEALLALVEWLEERAGLMEYEAGMVRDEAEREAWKQLVDVLP